MATREDEKISFYTFPRNVRSHNVYMKNCLVQMRKLYAKVCKYIQGHGGDFKRLFYLTFTSLNCEGKCIFK